MAKIITEGKRKINLTTNFPFFWGYFMVVIFYLNPSIILIIALTLSLLIDLFILEKVIAAGLKI